MQSVQSPFWDDALAEVVKRNEISNISKINNTYNIFRFTIIHVLIFVIACLLMRLVIGSALSKRQYEDDEREMRVPLPWAVTI